MTSFFELFLGHAHRPIPESDPTWADRDFTSLLKSSPFHLWRPGDSIRERGIRLLIGVSTWSGYDMRMLDVIAEAIERRRTPADLVVEVFKTSDCKQQRDFRQYVPKLRHVVGTPVVGLWRDGQLVEAKHGYYARDLAARLFGFSDSAEVVDYLWERLKVRSANP